MKRPTTNPSILRTLFSLASGICLFSSTTFAAVDVMESLPLASYRFGGLVGERIESNIQNWLIPMPVASPAIIGMFYRRDEQPPQDLVPWAGGFAGEYLIAAIQALRLTGSAELRRSVEAAVEALIASQAESGYLGFDPVPFKPGADLWGHSQSLIALLMWYEATGEERALQVCRRAADLLGLSVLEVGVRVSETEFPGLNRAILNGLGKLYRATQEPRYLAMMRVVEADWTESESRGRQGRETASGASDRRNRGGSLQATQGLLELFRITGQPVYRDAFTNRWWTLLGTGRRPSGAFAVPEISGAEPGDPDRDATCATAAWMALTVDMLRVSGEGRAADELELSTFNAAAGAQHPSGRWWSAASPLNGMREPSSRVHADQAAPGMAGIDCCSVSGPQTLGLLSEWAVMRYSEGLVLNYLGAGVFQGKLDNNTPVALEVETGYPVSGKIEIRVEPLIPRRFSLKIRVPAWANTATVQVNGRTVSGKPSGGYVTLDRAWRERDLVTLSLNLPVRSVRGDRKTSDLSVFYRGPLLLACDQQYSPFNPDAFPVVDVDRLSEAVMLPVDRAGVPRPLKPWVLVEVVSVSGKRLRLCDFASAGVFGTRYQSWLPVAGRN